MMVLLLLFLRYVTSTPIFEEGETCKFKDGSTGICKLVIECASAQELLNYGLFPEICPSDAQHLVCCKDDSRISSFFIDTTLDVTHSIRSYLLDTLTDTEGKETALRSLPIDIAIHKNQIKTITMTDGLNTTIFTDDLQAISVNKPSVAETEEQVTLSTKSEKYTSKPNVNSQSYYVMKMEDKSYVLPHVPKRQKSSIPPTALNRKARYRTPWMKRLRNVSPYKIIRVYKHAITQSEKDTQAEVDNTSSREGIVQTTPIEIERETTTYVSFDVSESLDASKETLSLPLLELPIQPRLGQILRPYKNEKDQAVTTMSPRLDTGSPVTYTPSMGTPISTSSADVSTNIPHRTVKRAAGEISKERCREYLTYAYSEDYYDISNLISVVGGKQTKEKEFPHMAMLCYNSEYEGVHCGGSLISKNFVLTAGHCIVTTIGTPKSVRLGVTHRNDLAYLQELEVSEAMSHPEYKRKSKYHDIGLLKLATDVIFNDYIRPACLNDRRDLGVKNVIATGWGETESGENNHLLKVHLHLHKPTKCNKTFRTQITNPKGLLKRGVLDEQMICAGSMLKLENTCRGDSGGPLQVCSFTEEHNCLYHIVGITSFGKPCMIEGTPGIYTRVSFYLQWIEDMVWPNWE